MKLRLLKDWLKDTGYTVPKGREIFVTQELGEKLVRQKKAVEVVEFEEKKFNFETIEVKSPLTK
jgi:hypothetical protein